MSDGLTLAQIETTIGSEATVLLDYMQHTLNFELPVGVFIIDTTESDVSSSGCFYELFQHSRTDEDNEWMESIIYNIDQKLWTQGRFADWPKYRNFFKSAIGVGSLGRCREYCVCGSKPVSSTLPAWYKPTSK